MGAIEQAFAYIAEAAAKNIANNLKSSNVTAQQAVLDLCAIFGWKKIDQALVYYNPDVSDIADRTG